MLEVNKKPKLSQGQIVGIIANSSTENIINRDFKTKKMNIDECEDLIESNNIEIVFIENNIYEEDHDWYDYTFEDIVEYFSKLNINIIIINTSDDLTILDNKYFQINFTSKYKEITYTESLLTSPLMINEKKINPINDKKLVDIALLNLEETQQEDIVLEEQNPLPEGFNNFIKIVKPKMEILNCSRITSSFIKSLIKKIKKSKVLYINYTSKVPKSFLEYVELICVLQNTTIVLDPQFDLNLQFALKASEPESNMNFLQSFINDGLYNDHRIIKNAREAFINNTLIQYSDFSEIINGGIGRKPINVSVVTSTKRKWTIDDYIARLNSQNGVSLEAVLLTHGFELNENEIQEIQKKAKFPLKIISASTNIVFGACLNMCIDEITNKYFTKIDDDDFYYPNYLLDSWIGLRYSQADIVGKYSQFVYMEESDLTVQRFKSRKYLFSEYIAGATLFCETEFIKTYMFSEIPKAVDSDILRRIMANNGKIFCTHPYEFCIYRADDKEAHTWTAPDTHLLRSADILFYGDPVETISIS